ncbi:hypothetical protein AB205_0086110 [Aquarana catesbeiana]|uniref:Uncharacterized protein n=1 Tax=Aquarana catesbeiana TaxID=8400 RepID=A0A2G9S4V9_AQUCT|nr:hypothetical protein AB205_0086110 [Aquarana catesbeiana]
MFCNLFLNLPNKTFVNKIRVGGYMAEASNFEHTIHFFRLNKKKNITCMLNIRSVAETLNADHAQNEEKK